MRICAKCGAKYMRDEPFCNKDGSPTNQATALMDDPKSIEGATLGNYVIQNLLGVGGMGKVYKAEHTLLGRPVALKLLHEELTARADLVTRFFNEARAVNQIRHENIIDVTDFGTTADGRSYFVMELLEGGRSLEEAVKNREPMAIPQALAIATQIASALSAAHAKGIVHRDLKPANVIMVPRSHTQDFVKLLDFGIAKLTDLSVGDGVTRAGMIMGTPTYMSPEQATGDTIDSRSDIYSFGIILYQLVSAKVPFKGDSLPALIHMHLNVAPMPPRALSAAIAPSLERLILRCLAKKREDRFQSMEEVLDALKMEIGALSARSAAVARLPHLVAPPEDDDEGPTRIADANSLQVNVALGSIPPVQGPLAAASGTGSNPSVRSPAPGTGRNKAVRPPGVAGPMPSSSGSGHAVRTGPAHPALPTAKGMPAFNAPTGTGQHPQQPPPAGSGPYGQVGSGPYPQMQGPPFAQAGTGPFGQLSPVPPYGVSTLSASAAEVVPRPASRAPLVVAVTAGVLLAAAVGALLTFGLDGGDAGRRSDTRSTKRPPADEPPAPPSDDPPARTSKKGDRDRDRDPDDDLKSGDAKRTPPKDDGKVDGAGRGPGDAAHAATAAPTAAPTPGTSKLATTTAAPAAPKTARPAAPKSAMALRTAKPRPATAKPGIPPPAKTAAPKASPFGLRD